MIIVNDEELEKFRLRYRDADERLGEWKDTVSKAKWSRPDEVQGYFSRVRILGGGLLLFDIKGNHYRLLTHVDYQRQVVTILFIGTHSQYDRIKARDM